jgi:hypothetical protein
MRLSTTLNVSAGSLSGMRATSRTSEPLHAASRTLSLAEWNRVGAGKWMLKAYQWMRTYPVKASAKRGLPSRLATLSSKSASAVKHAVCTASASSTGSEGAL